MSSCLSTKFKITGLWHLKHISLHKRKMILNTKETLLCSYGQEPSQTRKKSLRISKLTMIFFFCTDWSNLVNSHLNFKTKVKQFICRLKMENIFKTIYTFNGLLNISCNVFLVLTEKLMVIVGSV